MAHQQPFGFSFSGADIDTDKDEGADVIATTTATTSANTNTTPATVAAEPRVHALEELLSSIPSRISYTTPATQTAKGNTVRIPRRELFDIRMQLMAEDDDDDNDENSAFLASLGDDDIKTNVYEGGLKSWECSVDLVSILADDRELWESGEEGLRVMELGCGTALPTLYLFQQALLRHIKAPRFSIADYNVDVLRLVTVPNLFLSWAMITSTSPDLWPAEDDLEITPDLLQRFTADLDARRIAVDIVSGAWGPRFVELVPAKPHLVLASETIYSPASLPTFTQTLVEVVDRHGNHVPRALVAAKMVYFGVGGGVYEFLRLLKDQYKHVGEERYVFDTSEAAEKSGGVARVVLELPLC
ncbi:hypothetical protein GP486_004652 [Trichoglossum hirsutum]|uniref:protein-histidine N-methyltransferase n=1 Tax=Trichoglossum hirsutum TaxID=265104 RepID=A0A9P8LAS0_9PEZI|nr:hypothetical protein GP486_004652 [Trichoglossum hirsutum]